MVSIEFVELLASRCSVPMRFAKFVMDNCDYTPIHHIQLLQTQINYLKTAVRIATLGIPTGGYNHYNNEVEIQALALMYKIPVNIAKIVISSERYECVLTRQERCLFLKNIFKKLIRDVYHILP